MIFVKPEIPRKPNIILIGERPGSEEAKAKRPFVGPAGKLLRTIIAKTEARPIILNSVNTYAETKPTTEEINEEREKVLIPLLEKFPSIPVLALGAYAAQAIFKGKHGEGSMAGQSLFLHGRPVLFTYHPSYWFYTKPFPKDDRVLEHIEIMLRAALVGEMQINYEEGRLPRNVEEIIVDVETDSNDYPWYGSQLVTVGIQPAGFLPYILRVEELSAADKDRLNRDVKRVIGHNLVFDLVHLRHVGIQFPSATLHDTMTYDRYTHGGELFHDLKFLAKKRLHFGAYEAKARQWWEDGKSTKKDEEKKTTRNMPREILHPYNAGDLYATEGIYNNQQKRLPQFDLDMDYIKYAVQMTMNGIYVSRRKLQMIGKEVLHEKDKLESKFKRIAGVGKDFNPRSPDQLRSLFTRQNIIVSNTKEDTLIAVKDKHPMIQVLLDYKNQETLYGRGVVGLRKRIDENGLVHSTFGTTETSRLTSSNPNIQNIDPRIRPSFRSRHKNGLIIHPDLSQLEYRIIAHVANEMKLIRTFRNDEDIHTLMYQYLFGRKPKNETERKEGKTNNYASVYGEGFKKFLSLTQLDAAEAKPLFYRAKAAYPAINEYREEVAGQLATYRRIKNLFGRIRTFEEPELRDMWSATREAFNWLFQSAGHDVLKIWLMAIANQLPPEVILAADEHDEIILDVPPTFKRTVLDLIPVQLNDLIADAFGVRMKVPMIAEIQMGKEWH